MRRLEPPVLWVSLVSGNAALQQARLSGTVLAREQGKHSACRASEWSTFDSTAIEALLKQKDAT